MFDRYARAISDERDRKTMRSLYVTKNVFLALTVVFLVVAFGCSFAINDYPVTNAKPAVFWATFFCMLFVILFAFAFLVLQIIFSATMKKIVNAPARGGEEPQIVAYRAKYGKAAAAERKRNLPAIIILIVSMIVFVVLIAIDTFKNDTDEIFTPLGIAAIAVLIVGFAVFVFCVLYNQLKKTSDGQTFEQQTESEAAAIDAEQGRQTKYRLEADKNLNNLLYIMPDAELRRKTEEERKKYYKFMYIGLLVGFVLSMIVCLVCLCGFVFKETPLYGYVMPALMLCIFGCEFIFITPSALRVNKLEKEQLAIMRSNAEYADNLEIYNLYKRHSITWGMSALYAVIISFFVSLGLAVAFPDKLYSLLTFLIIAAGLFINVRATISLRKKCKPIEARIDAANAPNAEEYSGDIETAADGNVQNGGISSPTDAPGVSKISGLDAVYSESETVFSGDENNDAKHD